MTEKTKTLLIVGGIAIVAYLAYKKFTGGIRPSPVGSTGGTQNTQPQAGATTSGSFWDTLGAVGKGLNGAVSAAESTYNSVYDLFGGNTSTQPPSAASPNQVAGSP